MSNTWTYDTPAQYVFRAPSRGLYQFECWGASGGDGDLEGYPIFKNRYRVLHGGGCAYKGQIHYSDSSTSCTQCNHNGNCITSITLDNESTTIIGYEPCGSVGGKGAYVKGVVYLKKNEEVILYVGGKGGSARTPYKSGGFNGGGDGSTDGTIFGYGGGGATDVRYKGDYYSNRIIVAGGGGGADSGADYIQAGRPGSQEDGSGGDGGFNGHDPKVSGVVAVGYGATQHYGAMVGQGEHAINGTASGGGGAGYYGGRATNTYCGGGGGGSSYVNDIYVRDKEIQDGVNKGDGKIVITKIAMQDNFNHFTLYSEGNYYITLNKFYDQTHKKFIPIPIEELSNFDYSDDFIVDIREVTRGRYIDDEYVQPLEQFRDKDVKIAKIAGYNNKYYSNPADVKTDSVNISLRYTKELLKSIMVKIKNKFVQPTSIFKYFMSVNQTDAIKIGIVYNNFILGKDYKIIQEEEIIDKGFDASDFNDERIKLKDFSMIFVFNRNVFDDSDELKFVNIIKRDTFLRRIINRKRYNVTYDTNTGKLYIRFLYDSGRIVVNKLESADKEYHIKNTIEEF